MTATGRRKGSGTPTSVSTETKGYPPALRSGISRSSASAVWLHSTCVVRLGAVGAPLFEPSRYVIHDHCPAPPEETAEHGELLGQQFDKPPVGGVFLL